VYPLVDFMIPRAEKEARYRVAEEAGRRRVGRRWVMFMVRRRGREEGAVGGSWTTPFQLSNLFTVEG
jgi:hypothetical protein